MRVILSPHAESDLEEIGDFIARDNPRRAVSFVRELRSACVALGQSPGIGALRPELGEGIRMLPHGRYLIFHRQEGQTLRIERIMHSARDIGSDDIEIDG